MNRRNFMIAGALLPGYGAYARTAHYPHPVGQPSYTPPYSDIVANSTHGIVHATSSAIQIKPASLVKLMTLHLLFSALESGRLKSDETLVFSVNAAGKPSTHLGLSSGAVLGIGDAVSALCVHSCNDVACAVAEKLSGTEEAFVEVMNSEAGKLGLKHTHFGNASGLPHPGNISTATDLLLLGTCVINRHPTYAGYLALRSWTYGDKTYSNTNRLLETYEGMDAGKTGYIAESGFNLFASAFRGNVRVVAVITGGFSAADRDERMRGLLDKGFLLS